MGSQNATPPTQPLTYHEGPTRLREKFRSGSVLARKNMDVSAKRMDVSANKI